MATAANFQTNQSLPFYPTGNVTGAILTLTQARNARAAPASRQPRPLTPQLPAQDPCNNPFHRNQCCAPKDGEIVCANWTGAHAISAGAPLLRQPPCSASGADADVACYRRAGCILYGTLTAEMGMKMPRGAQGAWHRRTPVSQTRSRLTWLHAALWDFGTYVNGGVPDPTWCVVLEWSCVAHGSDVAAQERD